MEGARNVREIATLAAGTAENAFRDAADVAEHYLTDGLARLGGAAETAIMHLTVRSLADLRCGQLLAGSGFPVQAASVMRPVREALNLVELFHLAPDRAEGWAAGDHWRFQAGAVRRELGIGEDEIYSWLSEISHPRFRALQVSMYWQGEGQEQAVVYFQGLPLEIPAVLHATTLPSVLLCQVAEKIGYVRVRTEVAVAHTTMMREVIEAILPGVEAVHRALREIAPDDSEAESEAGIIRHLREMLETARELEREVQEALHADGEAPG